jgi:alpha-tubulin suppressor-like RCC1 family protein
VGAALAAFALSSCSDKVEPLDLAGPGSAMSPVSGNAQTGLPGAALPAPFVVRVTDLNGRPVPGVSIGWSAQRGAVSSAFDTTDNDGIASVGLRLPATTGVDTVVANAGTLGSASFGATAAPIIEAYTFRYVDAGSYHACGMTTTEEFICWGYNGDGQLGFAGTAPVAYPTLLVSDTRYRQISGGRYHTCGLSFSGIVACFGGDIDGRLGNDNPPVTFQSVAAGRIHSCGISLSRQLWCWGSNGEGELGNGQGAPGASSPTKVFVEAGDRAVAPGGLHTCAVNEGGAVRCWGFNGEGQLGDGTNTTRLVPTAIGGGLTFQVDPVIAPPAPDPDFPLPPGPFLTAGYAHSCAVATGGTTYCWGLNEDGQLGDGTRAARTTPTAVTGGSTFVALSAGYSHTCGLTAAGAMFCWGDNTFGQLGNDSRIDALAPVAVGGGLVFGSLKAGDLSTCGVTTTGVAYCWGNNEYAQLGNGSKTDALLPVKVAFQP